MLVVAAAILHCGRVLAAQRAYPPDLAGRWEFPGGKVERGEAPRDALAREITEELAVNVDVDEQLGPEISLGAAGRLRLYRCALRDTASPVPRLGHHAAVRWLSAGELLSVTWLPADAPLLGPVRFALEGRLV